MDRLLQLIDTSLSVFPSDLVALVLSEVMNESLGMLPSEVAHLTFEYTYVKAFDGSDIGSLEGHTDGMQALISLADGHLVSGSDDHTIRIWDCSTGECKRVLKGHKRSVYSLVQVSDDHLASGSVDKTIRIWDIQTGACKHVLKGHTNNVDELVLLRNGQLASSSNFDHTIRIWDTNTGECKKILKGYNASAFCSLVLLSDGRLASGTTGIQTGSIRIWNTTTGERTDMFPNEGDICQLKRISDNLLAAGVARQIKLWDIDTGECKRVLEGHKGNIMSLDVLGNGDLVSSAMDNTIRIWDVNTGDCKKVLHRPCSMIAVLPNVQLAAVVLDGWSETISSSSIQLLR